MLNNQPRTSLRNYLVETYGRNTRHLVRQFEKALRRRANLTNHLNFNLRCKSESLIPKSLRVETRVKTAEGRRIAETAARAFLRARIRVISYDLGRARNQVSRTEEQLKVLLSLEDFTTVQTLCLNTAEHTFQKLKKRHEKKTEWLTEEKSGWNKRKSHRKVRGKLKERWMVNLSKATFTDDEEDILRLGLNFVPTPKKVPIMDHIAGVEAALQRAKLPPDTSEEIKAKVCCLFRSTPKPNSNLSTSQHKAIKSLRKRDDIVILKADKGNATVILDKDEYHQKCVALLQPPTYLPLTRNPTSRVERRVTI